MPMNRKIGTISKKFPRPYEGIFNTGTPGPITRSVSGQNLITLNNAIANELLEVKAFGGIRQELPEGYKKLDYIKGDGNAYIDLLTALTQDDEIEIEISFPNISNSGENIFGYRNSASQNNIMAFFASTAFNLVLDFNNSDYSSFRLLQALNYNTKYKLLLSKSLRAIYQGETLVASNNTACSDNITIPNVYLFQANGTPSSNKCFKGEIYSCKIKNKLNLIPCKNASNQIGMFDTIHGKFYGNVAGSGNFVAGNELLPSPTNPMDISCNNGILKVSGNILDMSIENIVLGKYIDNSGVVQNSPQNFYNSKYIPVAHDEIYTRSTTRNVRYVSIMEYDIDKTFIKRTLFNNGTDGKNSGSLTIGSTTAFVLFGSNPLYADITMDDIFSIHRQFEKSSVGTAQPEYGIYADGTQEVIEDSLGNSGIVENLLSIASIKDEQELLTGNIVRHVGIKILDGSENRTKVSSPLGNIYQADLLDQNMFSHLICTHFENDAPLNDNTIHKSAGSSIVEIRYDTASTVQDFVQFLISQYTSGNPVLVVYGLQSPTTETVTGQTFDIATGTNTIEITQASIDPLTLSAKYKATA